MDLRSSEDSRSGYSVDSVRLKATEIVRTLPERPPRLGLIVCPVSSEDTMKTTLLVLPALCSYSTNALYVSYEDAASYELGER